MEDQTKPRKQRLAIFLDGTWNTQDDSTNIFHAHALTFAGETDDGFIQKKYYDRGVGTGMFDSVLGGGFGIGLEVNVREAYNWLVDHYNDGDEVYIFGFSRGAYTARSLVGFISMCGLIRRGAPLTNSQLWDGYVKISRQRGRKKTLFEMIGEVIPPPFRPIKQIRKGHGKNLTENLLKQWSRRIEITYLGIFDTVGAMGLEALGLQGIRSKSGMNHNQNPTKLIIQCRHALAIDENRSSFRLTPFLHYVPNKIKDIETVERQGYKGIISQKWFIGAHSNIGGGYNNNLLAYYPLNWVLEGAIGEGLKMRALKPSDLPANVNQANDSYADFTGLVWPHILREKRHYRVIDRDEIIVAGRYGKRDKTTGISKRKEPGFSLVPIYEEIDDSVIQLIKDETEYVPINLKNYSNRIRPKNLSNNKLTQKEKNDIELNRIFEDRTPQVKWLEESPLARIILVIWATFAALGFSFLIDKILINTSFFEWQYLGIFAIIFSLADWGEFHFNLKTGLNTSNIKANVIQNVCLWFRLVGIVCFFVGTIFFFYQSINWGWSTNQNFLETVDLVKNRNWFLIPFFPALLILILDILYNGKIQKNVSSPFSNLLKRIGATLVAPFLILIVGLLTIMISDYLDYFSIDNEATLSTTPLKSDQLAGQLLFLQMLFLVFYYIVIWVLKPTRRARLQFIILGLQKAYTPEIVKEQLKIVRFNISRPWVAKEKEEQKTIAWNHAKKIIRKTFYRENFGLIPAYFIVFSTTIWMASSYGQYENWIWLESSTFLDIPFWIWLLGAAVIADYIENWIHLKHLDNFPTQMSSFPLVLAGMGSTIIKFLGFVSVAILSFLIFFDLTGSVFSNPGGWRWLIATLITLVILGSIAIRIGNKFIRK